VLKEICHHVVKPSVSSIMCVYKHNLSLFLHKASESITWRQKDLSPQLCDHPESNHFRSNIAVFAKVHLALFQYFKWLQRVHKLAGKQKQQEVVNM